MTKIQYRTNEEYWAIKADMRAKGYVMTGDCYWCQVFTNGKETVVAERI